jgi:hypothetical protein
VHEVKFSRALRAQDHLLRELRVFVVQTFLRFNSARRS